MGKYTGQSPKPINPSPNEELPSPAFIRDAYSAAFIRDAYSAAIKAMSELREAYRRLASAAGEDPRFVNPQLDLVRAELDSLRDRARLKQSLSKIIFDFSSPPGGYGITLPPSKLIREKPREKNLENYELKFPPKGKRINSSPYNKL